MTTRFIIKKYGYNVDNYTYAENFETKEEAIQFAADIKGEYETTNKLIVERTIDEKTFEVREKRIGVYDKFNNEFVDQEEEYAIFEKRI